MNIRQGFFERKQDGNWVIEFTRLNSWEEFRLIADAIVKHEDAAIRQRNDGPDARRWIIEVDGVNLELCHDDMGINWLVAPLSYQESAHRICEEAVSYLTRDATVQFDSDGT